MRPDIAVLYFLLRLLALLPLRVLHAIGSGLGRLMGLFGARAAHTARVNMSIARRALDEDEQRRLAAACLRDQGKSMLEMASVWGSGARRALRHVREVRGEAHFRAALERGKGVIIAAPHLGCWELLNYWLCSQTRMAILYRPPHVKALEALLRKVRGDLAPEQVRAEGAGVRTLFKRLAAGGTVGILPDQKPRQGEGRYAPFYGRRALTMVLLPRLAARTGATVLFAFAERLPKGAGYRIHLLPAPEGLDDADPDRACAALNRGVEACVERAFTQYQWTYRRYTPPAPGDGNPYNG
ncbi:lipid A biosynthesis acyltransferase [Oleiagrimonas soli]|uniref:KDO2-lipid IV(A) lauroyltransferase n=1 Tax=Oleiagrimonas soli TaxID=1543381 RepID=A0A099CT22_9GAMM|nr:lipid A biosynthesis acyltransferase [Oleiagrimonas soli]KGI76782.1 lipid A biosynthesis acyltransferase [Oleiagrimonas soli]MBB6184974.1 KDO2-lipid IV(A) lauroyltransferase [Oleiagrimonas soli]